MGGSMSRRKGKTYEREVEVWLTEAGISTDRTMTGESVEDICVHDLKLSLECKNHKTLDLSGWLTQAISQAARRGLDWVPIVIHKRRGCTDVGEHYATLRVCDLMVLIDRGRS